jgi:uroporphyrinogen-III synthase
MRLLVTRPEPDATETAERLRARGHEVLVWPLLRIDFAEPPVDVPEPAAIILTSRNGVRALSRWPQISGWLARPVFVTGVATAALAREAGFTDVRTPAGDAAELMDFFMSEIGKDRGPILYVAARDRAGALAGGLGANGYDIRAVVAYSAEMETTLVPSVREALRSRAIDGILFYSYRTATAFRQIVEREKLVEQLAGISIFTLSGRVAGPLHGLPVEIRIAPNPNEESLLALLPREAR